MEENVKNLILYEIKLNKELKNIKKISAIYGDEISEHKQNLHITKDGKVMFIPDMEDSHLINTVKYLMRNGLNFHSRKIKKYISEVKKRGLVSEILEEQSALDNADMPSDDYDDEFNGFVEF